MIHPPAPTEQAGPGQRALAEALGHLVAHAVEGARGLREQTELRRAELRRVDAEQAHARETRPMAVQAGREFLAIPGPTTIPDEVLRAMHRPAIDIYAGSLLALTDSLLRDLSRLFVYYNERAIEGTVGTDSGAQIRDGVKSVAKLGACFETGANPWPYRIPNFTEKPPAACYSAAAKHQIVQYSSIVPILSQLKGCLAAGFPFVFGFTVYERKIGRASCRERVFITV